MPRYYFHIRKGEVHVEDPEGTEVSQTESLEDDAIEAARDLLADGDRQGLIAASGCSRWRTRVGPPC